MRLVNVILLSAVCAVPTVHFAYSNDTKKVTAKKDFKESLERRIEDLDDDNFHKRVAAEADIKNIGEKIKRFRIDQPQEVIERMIRSARIPMKPYFFHPNKEKIDLFKKVLERKDSDSPQTEATKFHIMEYFNNPMRGVCTTSGLDLDEFEATIATFLANNRLDVSNLVDKNHYTLLIDSDIDFYFKLVNSEYENKILRRILLKQEAGQEEFYFMMEFDTGRFKRFEATYVSHFEGRSAFYRVCLKLEPDGKTWFYKNLRKEPHQTYGCIFDIARRLEKPPLDIERLSDICDNYLARGAQIILEEHNKRFVDCDKDK